MQNIRFLISFLLINTAVHGMQPIVPNPWDTLPIDIKTGIVARSQVMDKKNLRLVNTELALLASKANFKEMINHFPCILDRTHHLEFMINYSLKKDRHFQNIIAKLIKNAHLCDHEDLLDIVPHFYSPIKDSDSLINALNSRNFSSINKEDLPNIIPILTQIYKKNQNYERLPQTIVPEIMDIYSGNELAIDRYINKYQDNDDNDEKKKKGIATHLHIAVEYGHIQVAELFVTQNPNLLNIPDANGFVPMSIAAEKGKAEIIKLFQKFSTYKSEQTIDTPFDKSPYFFAAIIGNEQCLQLLLNHDDCTDFLASQSLLTAVANGDLEITTMLLEHPKVNVNYKCILMNNAAIHIAIAINNIPLLKLLLAKGALLNEKDAAGNTPLISAVQNDALETVNLLVKQPHIDINAYIDPDLELLQKYSLTGRINEKQIADIKTCQGFSALCCAACLGNAKIVQVLLDNGAALHNNYRTPLMLAAQNGHCNVAKQIINHSPHTINETINEGCTALFFAISTKQTDIIELLLDNGALVNLNMKPLGLSPLLQAINIGDLNNVQLLVQRGADINYEMMPGVTPLNCAQHKRNQPIIDFLLSQPNIIK